MRRGNESAHRATCSHDKYPTKRLPDNISRRHLSLSFGQQDPRTLITTSERRFCKKAMSAPRDSFWVGTRSVAHWEQTRRYSNGGTKDGVMGKERALRTRMEGRFRRVQESYVRKPRSKQVSSNLKTVSASHCYTAISESCVILDLKPIHSIRSYLPRRPRYRLGAKRQGRFPPRVLRLQDWIGEVRLEDRRLYR